MEDKTLECDACDRPGDGRRHESVTDDQWAIMCMTSDPFGHIVSDDGRCVACTLAMGRESLHGGAPAPPRPPEGT